MLRCFKLLNGIALALGFCSAAWAAQAEYPYPTPVQQQQPCPIKARATKAPPFGGYYQTQWRQWPGEERLEVKNPRAVTSEVIATPQGQKQIQTPPMAPREMPQEQQPLMPQEGELLPPGGEILPPEKPAAPKRMPVAPPEHGKKEIKSPSAAGLPGLPGLPAEAAPDKKLPGIGEPKNDAKPQPPAEKPQSGTQRYESTEPTPVVIMPIERLDSPEGPMVLSVSNQEPAPSGPAASLHHADTIADAVEKPNVENAAFATAESSTPTEPSKPAESNAPPAAGSNIPRVAIGGYCPVELIQSGQWVSGDLRFTVVHNGWIYRLSGQKQWQAFSDHPEAFTPAYAGNDAVLAVEEQREAAGQIAYCATYNGRLYMFSTAATQAKFNKDPRRYAVEK